MASSPAAGRELRGKAGDAVRAARRELCSGFFLKLKKNKTTAKKKNPTRFQIKTPGDDSLFVAIRENSPLPASTGI